MVSVGAICQDERDRFRGPLISWRDHVPSQEELSIRHIAVERTHHHGAANHDEAINLKSFG